MEQFPGGAGLPRRFAGRDPLGARWLSLFSFGWLLRKWRANPPNSLLDNTPLVSMLHRLLDLPRLDAALAEGQLHALAVTASSYTSGQHITFYQCAEEIEPWRRTQRLAMRDQIGIDHLLASSAIPFIFPAIPVYIDGRCEYCGDGSMRQIAPISPAIHLGATKVLIIGAGRMGERRAGAHQYAALSQPGAGGRACDVGHLPGWPVGRHRTHQPGQPDLSVLNEEQRRHTPLKPIRTLVISPSHRIDSIASRHVAACRARSAPCWAASVRPRPWLGAGVLPVVRTELHQRVDRPGRERHLRQARGSAGLFEPDTAQLLQASA
jgi:NTE family protein